jgi:hypothetical protein
MKAWILVLVGYFLLGIVVIHWLSKKFTVGLSLSGYASTMSWVGPPIFATILAMTFAFLSWQRTPKKYYILFLFQIGLVSLSYYSFRVIQKFLYKLNDGVGQFPTGLELINIPFFILFLAIVVNLWIRKKRGTHEHSRSS